MKISPVDLLQLDDFALRIAEDDHDFHIYAKLTDGSNGLTRSIIFSDTGIEAEAWAKDVLGLDVTARLNPGDKESEPSFAH